MEILSAASLNLPPMTRLAATLFLLLFIPPLAQRLRIPSCVGFILAGVIVGPHGIGVIPRHAEAASLFADLGKLLLMFFIGLEIDLHQFSASRRRSILFGLLTFSLPMAAGTAIGFTFGYGPVSAVLIGSLLASHTLIAYPIIEAKGLVTRPSVTITVGATILTDMLSLLILAVCLTTHQSGFDGWGLVVQIGELVAFIIVVVFGLGRAGNWLFAHFGRTDDACFTLLLAIVSIAATLAELIKLEGILGAFLAGLAVNAAVRSSPAKEKLEFLGNAFFIPSFFIATGFLIDLRLFAATIVANASMVIAVVLSPIVTKWLAAQIAGRVWAFSAVDRGLMGSLTMPQVAATLAAALVGYQAINPAGVRLIDERMLNTILVLVVVTSVLGPILTERFASLVAGIREDEPRPKPDDVLAVTPS